MQRGRTQIHLLFAEDPVVPPQGHAAVVVDDFDATVAALVEAGLTRGSARATGAPPRAFVRSPAGHTVELMADRPAMRGGRTLILASTPLAGAHAEVDMPVWPPPPSPAPLSSSPPPSSRAATRISASAISFAPA